MILPSNWHGDITLPLLHTIIMVRSIHGLLSVYTRYPYNLSRLIFIFWTVLNAAGAVTTSDTKPGYTEDPANSSVFYELATRNMSQFQYFQPGDNRNIKARSIRFLQPRTRMYDYESLSESSSTSGEISPSKSSQEEFYKQVSKWNPSSTFLRSYFHWIINYTSIPFEDEKCLDYNRSSYKEYFCEDFQKELMEMPEKSLPSAMSNYSRRFKFCDMFSVYSAIDFSKCDLLSAESCGTCMDDLEEKDNMASSIYLQLEEIMNKTYCDPNPWDRWSCDNCTVSFFLNCIGKHQKCL